MLCNCLTKKNTHCQNPGTNAVQHENHVHDVCGSHMKSNDRRYFNCDRAREVPNPEDLAAVQQVFPITNTDQLNKLAELRDRIDTERTHIKEERPMIRIMATGHATLNNEPVVLRTLEFLLEGYINTYGKENVTVVSGGALGADRLWALAAVHLGVPYEIYVPQGYGEVFILQEKNAETGKWAVKANGRELLAKWYKMLEMASAVFDENGKPWTPDPENPARFHRGANFRRNTTMVKVSHHHFAVSANNPVTVITKKQDWRGGTYHCIKEMAKAGVEQVEWIPASANIQVVHTVNIKGNK